MPREVRGAEKTLGLKDTLQRHELDVLLRTPAWGLGGPPPSCQDQAEQQEPVFYEKAEP